MAHAPARTDWITHLSIEDDYGRIHEFELPNGGMSEGKLKHIILSRYRWHEAPKLTTTVTTALGDWAIKFWVACIAIWLLYFVFGPKFPADFDPRSLQRVFSLIEDRCVADIG